MACEKLGKNTPICHAFVMEWLRFAISLLNLNSLSPESVQVRRLEKSI